MSTHIMWYKSVLDGDLMVLVCQHRYEQLFNIISR